MSADKFYLPVSVMKKSNSFSAQIQIKAHTSNNYVEALLCTAHKYSIEERAPGHIEVFIHELEIDEFTEEQYKKIPKSSIYQIKKQLASLIKKKLLA